MKTINSKRRFYISGFDAGYPIGFTYFLDDFLNEENTYEVAYSLQDNLDKILDLNVGQALTMYSNRDSKVDKNLIIVYRNQ